MRRRYYGFNGFCLSAFFDLYEINVNTNTGNRNNGYRYNDYKAYGCAFFYFRNRFCFFFAAYRARTLGYAFFFLRSFFCYRPITKAMIFYRSLFLSYYHFIAYGALLTFRKACFRARCFFARYGYFRMTESGIFFCSCVGSTAIITFCSLCTGFFACCISVGNIFREAMSNSVDLITYISVAATHAYVGCISFSCACRGYNSYFVFVSFSCFEHGATHYAFLSIRACRTFAKRVTVSRH